jgi:hypothetical protein
MKLVKESLEEKEKKDTVIVKTSNPDQLKKILDCIQAVGNIGHTYEIVIDSEDNDDGSIERYKKKKDRTFEWDGDGSDHIDSVEIE